MNNQVNVFSNFYTTPRFGFNMSDGGGPFGFDIHYALEINFLVEKYKVDCIVETGTNSGDTTEYLCKTYPNLFIVSCETNNEYFEFAKKRLSVFKNLYLFNESSEIVVSKVYKTFNNPLFYLDAHWNNYWPLEDEIKNIKKGVVCVSDFLNPYIKFLNNNIYDFDCYEGKYCDSNLIKQSLKTNTKLYTNNILDLDVYEFPCLQNYRRAGRCYFEVDNNLDLFKNKSYFLEVFT
jgi:hypothetical protein